MRWIGMRALVVLCLLARIAAADRQQLAETRACVNPADGVVTQLVGDRLFVMRDDGFEENALWVISLANAPTPIARFSFAHMYAQSFRVTGDRLSVVGALPGEAPRVLELDARDFSLLPGEPTSGWPACSPPVPPRVATKAARADATTIVAVYANGPERRQGFLEVVRDGRAVGELDHDALVAENYASYCREVYRSRPRLPEERICSAPDYLRQRGSAWFEWMAITGNRLVSASTAGVAIHDLDTLAYVGGVSISALRAMSVTIHL